MNIEIQFALADTSPFISPFGTMVTFYVYHKLTKGMSNEKQNDSSH